MPMYEYVCKEDSKTDGKDAYPRGPHGHGHTFEKLLKMAEQGSVQTCPEHGCECQPNDFTTSTWVWGMNEVHWSAGLSQNTMGMNHAKRPGK